MTNSEGTIGILCVVVGFVLGVLYVSHVNHYKESIAALATDYDEKNAKRDFDTWKLLCFSYGRLDFSLQKDPDPKTAQFRKNIAHVCNYEEK